MGKLAEVGRVGWGGHNGSEFTCHRYPSHHYDPPCTWPHLLLSAFPSVPESRTLQPRECVCLCVSTKLLHTCAPMLQPTPMYILAWVHRKPPSCKGPRAKISFPHSMTFLPSCMCAGCSTMQLLPLPLSLSSALWSLPGPCLCSRPPAPVPNARLPGLRRHNQLFSVYQPSYPRT